MLPIIIVELNVGFVLGYGVTCLIRNQEVRIDVIAKFPQNPQDFSSKLRHLSMACLKVGIRFSLGALRMK